ncbi:uncharacterized protein C8A04DRAFT_34272 [Dichotomopilus funicola]|uniref:BHLH domain-containing protein n=1 Tax=Dichotomopilus funicola TaxID=1934379 RepID=A0AAN6ZRJ3_9PEZI|nr:hypothetical protein C8A04DRAFT_34272 [Dichotomopilus funicola]
MPSGGSSQTPSIQRLQSRQILSPHTRRREGHDRKRSRLSLETTTALDTIEYWMDFDNDDGLPDKSKPHSQSPPPVEEKGAAPIMEQIVRPTSVTETRESTDNIVTRNAPSDVQGSSSINLREQLADIDMEPPLEVPLREGLYSTPLSWERPQPGRHPEPTVSRSPPLNEEGKGGLATTTTNQGRGPDGIGSNVHIDFHGTSETTPVVFGASEEPEIRQSLKSTPLLRPALLQSYSAPPNIPSSRSQRRLDKKGGKEETKAADRAAHNNIERKYRTNLKDRILELQNAVPALRVSQDKDGDDDEETHPGNPPKISKSMVLTKATEYIRDLERRNKDLVEDQRELVRRLQVVEQLLSSVAQQQTAATSSTTCSRVLFDPRGFC